MPEDVVTMDKVVALCKRRGFVFPASEIYGGIGNTYDYGPLGVELKRRVKEAWWTRTVTMRDDVVGLDSAIIQNPKTWETSGHVAGFTDPMWIARSANRASVPTSSKTRVAPSAPASVLASAAMS